MTPTQYKTTTLLQGKTAGLDYTLCYFKPFKLVYLFITYIVVYKVTIHFNKIIVSDSTNKKVPMCGLLLQAC